MLPARSINLEEKNHYSVLLPRYVIYHKDLYADLETVLLSPVSS